MIRGSAILLGVLGICAQAPDPECPNGRCVATDTANIIGKPGPNKLEFQPPGVLVETEIGLSLLKDLSPSKTTKFDWSKVWKLYLEQKGKTPVKFPPGATKPPKQTDECITKFNAWIKYVAECDDKLVAYIDGPKVVTSENVTSICTAPDCTKPLCKASDKWRFRAVYETLKLGARSDDEDDAGPNVPPCLDFIPPTDPADPINAQLYREFAKLRPSPTTGVNWAEYLRNRTTIANFKPSYTIGGDDYPEGSFVNIYEAEGTCGKRRVIIRAYKLVVFITGATLKNCQTAKREKVPLDGC